MVSIDGCQALSFHEALCAEDAGGVRKIIRQGAYGGQTSGLAPGQVQASLVVMPRQFADDFLQFCKRNPKPLPLIGVSRSGVPAVPQLGDVDLRTDAPRYDVYRFGALSGQPTNITALWREDFSAFVLGSSHTFEHALAARGIRLRPLGGYRTLPMYRTIIPVAPAGRFGGNCVVSMRAIRKADIDRVRAVTARFPQAHGAPVHIGEPGSIGIADLARPDWGEAVTLEPDEVPVFWACGTTAHDALRRANLDICIMQSPGHMLLTDIDGRADIGPFKMY